VVNGSGNLSNLDPELDIFNSAGGYYPLLLGSPAIDAGNPTTPGSGGNACLGTDQRGVIRPQGNRCDIGAYEASLTFVDVQPNHWARDFVERLYAAQITGGCGINPLRYCPETSVTRAQMAVFLLRSIHDASYSPPTVGNTTSFGDVSTGHWAAAWIKQLAEEGITGGCGSGNFCPEAPVNRAQMAVFLLRSKYGASYAPPAVGNSNQLVAEGITSGCRTGMYCPESPVTRAQMAVFLVRTFNLP
jgi:hypothetical protein